MSDALQIIELVASQFPQLVGPIESVEPYGDGHLHKTYKVRIAECDYLFQSLGLGVFTDISRLMKNTELLCDGLVKSPPIGLKIPELFRAHDGRSYVECSQGVWRVQSFITNSCSFTVPESLAMAESAGHLVGSFLESLQRIEGLVEVLPRFQDLLGRFAFFRNAVAADIVGRAGCCKEEVATVLAREAYIREMLQCSVPQRNTHSDLKFNNLLFDRNTLQMVAVVDLDTCAPGSFFYDFGELVRAAGALADEDDPENMGIDTEKILSLVAAFRERLKGWITPQEWKQCVAAPEALALTLAVRFLADYLNGDNYFGVKYEDQNLRRAQAQIVLAESLAGIRAELESCLLAQAAVV